MKKIKPGRIDKKPDQPGINEQKIEVPFDNSYSKLSDFIADFQNPYQYKWIDPPSTTTNIIDSEGTIHRVKPTSAAEEARRAKEKYLNEYLNDVHSIKAPKFAKPVDPELQQKKKVYVPKLDEDDTMLGDLSLETQSKRNKHDFILRNSDNGWEVEEEDRDNRDLNENYRNGMKNIIKEAVHENSMLPLIKWLYISANHHIEEFSDPRKVQLKIMKLGSIEAFVAEKVDTIYYDIHPYIEDGQNEGTIIVNLISNIIQLYISTVDPKIIRTDFILLDSLEVVQEMFTVINSKHINVDWTLKNIIQNSNFSLMRRHKECIALMYSPLFNYLFVFSEKYFLGNSNHAGFNSFLVNTGNLPIKITDHIEKSDQKVNINGKDYSLKAIESITECKLSEFLQNIEIESFLEENNITAEVVDHSNLF